jgi:hypothetical protein
MKIVFVLQHKYEREPGVDEVKYIGVYSMKANAEEAIQRLMIQPEFRDHSDGFYLDEYELDQDHWVEGFGG